jgi:hypothetical protein
MFTITIDKIKMKHIKVFEEHNSGDSEIFRRIWEYSKNKWFIDGDDPPSEVIGDLENEESSDTNLAELIELTSSGPGWTDVWIEENTLIRDAVREGHSRDEIDADNQRYFAEHRKELIDKLSLKYPPIYWEKIK